MLPRPAEGKYVEPLPIENKLKESIYIEQVMVPGADKKFVGALYRSFFPNLKKDWAKKQKDSQILTATIPCLGSR